MRIAFSILAALVIVSLTTWLVAKDFGPEWTRDGDKYRRTESVPVSHSVGGNVTGYKLKLSRDTVWIQEIDDNLGITFDRRPSEEFKLRNGPDGAVSSYRIMLKNFFYHDLNGDGRIDSMSDNSFRPPKVSILFGDKWIPVRGSRGTADTTITSDLDFKIMYVFEDGKWRIKQ